MLTCVNRRSFVITSRITTRACLGRRVKLRRARPWTKAGNTLAAQPRSQEAWCSEGRGQRPQDHSSPPREEQASRRQPAELKAGGRSIIHKEAPRDTRRRRRRRGRGRPRTNTATRGPASYAFLEHSKDPSKPKTPPPPPPLLILLRVYSIPASHLILFHSPFPFTLRPPLPPPNSNTLLPHLSPRIAPRCPALRSRSSSHPSFRPSQWQWQPRLARRSTPGHANWPPSRASEPLPGALPSSTLAVSPSLPPLAGASSPRALPRP